MKMTAITTREPRRADGTRKAILSAISVSNATGLLTRGVRWCIARQKARSASRVLQVEETVSLGQKRFAAVIRVENARYLVGGGANEVVLLAALGDQTSAAAEEQNSQSIEASASSAQAEGAPEFRELLEQAGTAKKVKSEKTAAGRSKGGTKKCA